MNKENIVTFKASIHTPHAMGMISRPRIIFKVILASSETDTPPTSTTSHRYLKMAHEEKLHSQRILKPHDPTIFFHTRTSTASGETIVSLFAVSSYSLKGVREDNNKISEVSITGIIKRHCKKGKCDYEFKQTPASVIQFKEVQREIILSLCSEPNQLILYI